MNSNKLSIIVNSVEPYGYEIPNLLSLPKGSKFRFRFEESWCQKEDLSTTISSGVQNGYVILRDDSNNKFYPLRHINNIKVRTIGSIYYIECLVQDYFQYPSKQESCNSQLDEVSQHFTTHAKIDGKEMRPLVCLTKYSPVLVNYDAGSETSVLDEKAWFNIVSVLAGLEFFKNYDFYHISKFMNLKRNKVISVDSGNLNLDAGCNYEIILTQYCKKPNNQEGFQRVVTIESDNKDVKVLRGKCKSIGKYDVLKFYIQVVDRPISVNSFMDISYSVDDNKLHIVDPKLHIPIIIGRKPLLWRIASFILFVGLYAFTTVTGFGFAEYLGNPTWFSERIAYDFFVIGITLTLTDLLSEWRRRRE